MAGNNKANTVAAAQGRQERDSAAAGAHTPQERQEMVSMGLTETAVSQGRDPGQPVGTALPQDDDAV